MISYDPFWAYCKEKNISTYALNNDYGIDRRTIYKLKHDESLTLSTINNICISMKIDIEQITKIIRE